MPRRTIKSTGLRDGIRSHFSRDLKEVKERVRGTLGGKMAQRPLVEPAGVAGTCEPTEQLQPGGALGQRGHGYYPEHRPQGTREGARDQAEAMEGAQTGRQWTWSDSGVFRSLACRRS